VFQPLFNEIQGSSLKLYSTTRAKDFTHNVKKEEGNRSAVLPSNSSGFTNASAFVQHTAFWAHLNGFVRSSYILTGRYKSVLIGYCQVICDDKVSA
jgi:hypothetical protein